MVTRLSPARIVSTVMGGWFLATAFSQYLAGLIAQLTGVRAEAGRRAGRARAERTVHVYGDVFGQIGISARRLGAASASRSRRCSCAGCIRKRERQWPARTANAPKRTTRARRAAEQVSLAAERPRAPARARARCGARSGAPPPSVQIAVGFARRSALWATMNSVYQVVRKPTELFFPVSGTLYKTPAETWSAYQAIFRRHSTPAISAEFLAALAQVEASGNPVARTYWRWSWPLDPFEVYRPASSAVGMYQITDGTFEQARRYCIHRHVVVEDGPWYAWRSCWFNWLYFRVVPSHAVELTSAYLDRAVARALARHGIRGATLAQKEKLAALIHLCGAGAEIAMRGAGCVSRPGLRCGDTARRATSRA